VNKNQNQIFSKNTYLSLAAIAVIFFQTGVSHALSAEEAARIAPIGTVNIKASGNASKTPVAAAKEPSLGERIYSTACFACHGTGAAGAPKFGDTAAWQPRLKQGMDVLLKHAMEGFNAMPPKGGNPSLSEADIKAAIEHMAQNAK